MCIFLGDGLAISAMAGCAWKGMGGVGVFNPRMTGEASGVAFNGYIRRLVLLQTGQVRGSKWGPVTVFWIRERKLTDELWLRFTGATKEKKPEHQ